MATSHSQRIRFRVLQGLTGAGLQPLAQAIPLEAFPKQRHGHAMAAFGIGILLTPILGPTLGRMDHRQLLLALDLYISTSRSAFFPAPDERVGFRSALREAQRARAEMLSANDPVFEHDCGERAILPEPNREDALEEENHLVLHLSALRRSKAGPSCWGTSSKALSDGRLSVLPL
jgi:hypothetical protein